MCGVLVLYGVWSGEVVSVHMYRGRLRRRRRRHGRDEAVAAPPPSPFLYKNLALAV